MSAKAATSQRRTIPRLLTPDPHPREPSEPTLPKTSF